MATSSRIRIAALALAVGFGSVALGGCDFVLGFESITAGTVDVYNADDTLQASIDLGGEEGCGDGSTAVDATPTSATAGTLAVTATSDGTAHILGDDYVMHVAASLTGTYTGNGAVVGLTGDVTVSLDPSAGTGSCTKTSTDDCVISISGLTLAGAASPATLPTFLGATVTLAGASSLFSIMVGTGCPGSISAINDGYITISGLVIEP